MLLWFSDSASILSSTVRNSVLQFISRFTSNGQYEQVEEAFTCGCCYWFAFILISRFPNSTLMYDEIENHFAVMIDGVIYDITGDVTEKYEMSPWEDLGDDLLRARIVRDCILF